MLRLLVKRFGTDVAELQKRLRHCYSLGEYEEVRLTQAHKLAIELKSETQQTYGEDHPAHLSAMSNLALVLKTLGRYQEAEQLYTSAYEGYKTVLGPSHKSAVTVLHNLGLTCCAGRLKAKGEADRACKLLEQVIEYKEKTTEDWDLPATQIALGSCYRELNQLLRAQELLIVALTSLERKHGSGHLSLTPVLNALGLVAKSAKDYSSAQIYISKALQIRLEWSTADHPETLAIRHNLAEVYLAWGRVDEAQVLLKENIRLMEAKTKA